MGESRRSYVGLIIFLLCVLIVGIVFTARTITGSSPTTIVNIPTIETGIASSSDGEVHNVSIDFGIEVNKGDSRSLNSTEIKALIMDELQNLDYDQIIEKDNIRYIQSHVEEALQDHVEHVRIVAVYITDINSGDHDFAESGMNSNQTESRSDRLKRLNIK